MSDEQLFQDPDLAFMACITGQNLVKALRDLQAIDAETLMLYFTSNRGIKEIEVLMKDLVFFEAKVDKSFLRGLCVGMACGIKDFADTKKGDTVVPMLRAGLSLLRTTNTDVITGNEIDFNEV